MKTTFEIDMISATLAALCFGVAAAVATSIAYACGKRDGYHEAALDVQEVCNSFRT